MKELFKAAHKMAKEIKLENPEVDYRFQFSLCLSYLQEEGEKMENKITWTSVRDAAIKAVEEMGMTDYYVNNWKKGENDRTYIQLRYYRNGKCKKQIDCGYWDNLREEYITEDKYKKIYDLLKEDYVK